ncbi:MAG TPA: hypothetical protein VGR02_22155 [Thermoanaerobaculia bacterium]|jgi:hypothetical protein|nr:hypothetical protein [Thermoanaerobaculia bacterium]
MFDTAPAPEEARPTRRASERSLARQPIPRRLERLRLQLRRMERLLREYGGEDAVLFAPLLAALVRDPSYSREQALQLEAHARDAALRWPLRRLAALLLETALARVTDRKERRFWTARFRMIDKAELAREGYNNRESVETQLWRRLSRFARIHRLPLAGRVHDRPLRDFLHAAGRECRLTFARYLFTVEETIERMERFVRRSAGRPDPGRHGQFHGESKRAIENLPRLERAIAEHLGRDSVIRWAAYSTPSNLNSLVEFPLGTVVMTVKPPGSSHEFEIKRAGRPNQLPLDVVWARGNYIVPSSHHLDGGAMLQLLTFEAENSAFFSRVFREVHGFDASMSRTLYLSTIYTIPTADGGTADVLDYFTARRVFGQWYDDMRWNMRHVVKTLADYLKEPLAKHPSELALTVDFLGRVKPAQAIQLGTTSYRLDRLEKYLLRKGPDRYFREGLKVEHDGDADRRFADELLDELLGAYEPPRTPWRSHEQYIAAAYRVPANRSRANRNYVSVMEQFGRFWGTLLAIRGHTLGESFVARNAGLRMVWCDGEWQPRIVFMDHDSLSFGSVATNTFRPKNSVNNAAKDAKYVLGGVFNGRNKVRGAHSYLKSIYRVGPGTARRGVTAFRVALKDAYRATHQAMRTNPELNRMFRAPFIEKLTHWDELVSSYLQIPKLRSAREAWKAASRELLAGRGYNPEIAEEHVFTVTRQAKFLRRMGYLFR